MNAVRINKFIRAILVCALVIVFFSLYPVKFSWGLSKPAIYCGSNHSLALKEDGTVWAWGNNVFGQLGDGSSFNRSKPVQVKDLHNVKSIACRSGFSYALDENGTVYGWGRNGYATVQIVQDSGRITFYYGYDVDHPIKLNVPIKTDAIACSSNQFCAYEPHNNSVAVYTAGSYIANHMEKISMASDKDNAFKSILPCNSGWLGLDDDGQVWCKKDANSASTKIDGLSNIISITGDTHYAALKSDGTVWTWGNNASGQLGDGTLVSRQVPQKVSDITDVKQIAVAGAWTLALKEDGSVWMWGLRGILESKKEDEQNEGFSIRVVRRTPNVMFSSTEDNRKVVSTPTRVSGLSNIKSIAAGTYHCLAIKNDGTVWAWGYNDFGELGDGSTINRENPVMVKDFNVLMPITITKVKKLY